MTAPEVAGLFAALADAFEEQRDHLGLLDAAVGDGDHGASMARGFARARDAVAEQDGHDVGQLFQAAGRALMVGSGGASGALFATLFLELGKAAADREALDAERIAVGVAEAVTAIGRLGRSRPGDKTLLDALAPAAEALAANAQADAPTALAWAAEAAERGAQATRDLPARRGRGRYVPDAGLGHPDPGAVSVALIFATWRDRPAHGGHREEADQ